MRNPRNPRMIFRWRIFCPSGGAQAAPSRRPHRGLDLLLHARDVQVGADSQSRLCRCV